jgi:phosphoglycolate phosphatase
MKSVFVKKEPLRRINRFYIVACISIETVFLYKILIMIKNVLFDLDGTISDSQEGVIGSYQYTIGKLSRYHYEDNEIKKLIGTPLRGMLSSLLRSDDKELISEAVRLYRDKYSEIGITGNKAFPGITELLAALHRDSHHVFLVTMKNRYDAEKIIKFLGYENLFTGIYGPDLDGYPENKAQLIETAINEHGLVPEETVMVGDRKEDIFAGKSNGTLTIGITYGYGSKDEIIRVVPDCICSTPEKILTAIETL